MTISRQWQNTSVQPLTSYATDRDRRYQGTLRTTVELIQLSHSDLIDTGINTIDRYRSLYLRAN